MPKYKYVGKNNIRILGRVIQPQGEIECNDDESKQFENNTKFVQQTNSSKKGEKK